MATIDISYFSLAIGMLLLLIPIYYMSDEGKWRVIMCENCTPRTVEEIYENEQFYSRLLDINL